jgi:hypothetical protein
LREQRTVAIRRKDRNQTNRKRHKSRYRGTGTAGPKGCLQGGDSGLRSQAWGDSWGGKLDCCFPSEFLGVGLKRLNESQAHFGDLFVGNFLHSGQPYPIEVP